ncbi:MAG: ABC transporter substrate-binding protein [Streptosporangiales bacterium]|nr:ABC transporter substrate-binding protein [Streptosporangiales bacterium]
MRPYRRPLERALIVGIVALTLAACGSSNGGQSQGGGQPSGGQQKFTKAVFGSVSNLMHTPEYVAVQKGFYAQNGLNVQLKIFDSGSDVTKALKAGTVDFGSAGTTSVQPARAAGVPLKLLGGEMNDSTSAEYDGPLGIVGRKDRGVTNDPSSIKGKKIGSLAGSTTEDYLRLFLQRHHMTEKDVHIVNLDVPDHPVSLKQGDVDAVVSWEPYVSQEVKELGGNAVTVSRGDPLVGYVIGMGALDTSITSKRATVQKFVAAMAEADWYIRQHPDQAAAAAANYLQGLDVGLATEAIKSHAKWDPRISPCTEKAVDKATKDLVKAGKITKAMPVNQLVDTSFIDQVEKQHPEWFKDLPPLPKTC